MNNTHLTPLFALCLAATTLLGCDQPIDSETMNDPFADADSAGKFDHVGETFVERGALDLDGSRSGLVNANKWNVFDLAGFDSVDMPVLVNVQPNDGDMETYVIVWERGPVEPLFTGTYIGWSGTDSADSPQVQFEVEAGKEYRIAVRGLYKSAKGRFKISAMCGISDFC